MENDLVVEDLFERNTTVQSGVTDENTDEEEEVNVSEGNTRDKNVHVMKHIVSQDESSHEAELDPKIRKGLEKIRKLDAILADKLQVNCQWFKCQDSFGGLSKFLLSSLCI